MSQREHEWDDLVASVEDLPGVGRRYDVEGLDGGRLSVVIHRRTGEREVHAYGTRDYDPDAPARVVRFSDAQARTFGSILGGAFFKSAPVEELETVISELTIDWLTVPDGSTLAGRSIGEVGVRQRTGMTIMAIVRDRKVRTGPSSDDVVQAGDRIVVAGPRDGLGKLHRFLVPGAQA